MLYRSVTIRSDNKVPEGVATNVCTVSDKITVGSKPVLGVSLIHTHTHTHTHTSTHLVLLFLFFSYSLCPHGTEMKK